MHFRNGDDRQGLRPRVVQDHTHHQEDQQAHLQEEKVRARGQAGEGRSPLE